MLFTILLVVTMVGLSALRGYLLPRSAAEKALSSASQLPAALLGIICRTKLYQGRLRP